MAAPEPTPQYTAPEETYTPPEEKVPKKPTYKKPVHKGSVVSVRLLKESKELMDSLEEGHAKTKEALDNSLNPQ